MSHSPSLPLSSERGDFYNQNNVLKKCVYCFALLPEHQQNNIQDYYKCDCGNSSTEYTT